MRGLFRRIAVTIAGVAIVVGFATAPARPQFTSSGATVTTQIVSSTSPTGQSSVLALNGLYSNCSIVASESAGGAANITVYGNAQTGQSGPGGSPIVNGNFGTAGVIAVTPTLAVTSGNVANLPVGLYFTWASNTGTLTAYATCTSAIARASGGSAPSVTVTTAPCGSVPSAAANVLTLPFCGLPTYATTGIQQISTGTTANTYVQVGATLTLTLGNSGTANGWLVTIMQWGSPAITTGFASSNIYMCATSASTYTVLDATQVLTAQPCVTSVTNRLMGGAAFGEQSAAGLAQYGMNQITTAHVLVASNATFAVSFFGAGSTTTSVSMFSFGFVSAQPSS